MTTIKELENFTYTEYINLNNSYKIAQNWVEIIKDLPPKRQEKIKKSIDEGKDPLVHLKKIIKQKKEIIHTKYNFSKNLGDYGRLFAQNASLASLPREIRNSLASEQYYDVDMQCCHPTLLSQYCKKNGIRSDTLDKYIENRNEILDKLCKDCSIDKQEAKNVFLSLINGGKGGGWNIPKYKGTFIYDFKNEIEKIHQAICRLNPDEYKKAQRRKEYNAQGSMMNILLCKLEHMILMHSVLFMKQEGYNVDVLVFDGFMVRKNKELTEDVLKKLQKHIKDKTDYDMCFIEKTMDNCINLSKYADPVDDEIVDITYYKDKEKFEAYHLKIIHPAIYLTMIEDDTYDIQCEAKLISSYRHLKTTLPDEKNKIKKVTFINSWIFDENIRCYRRMVFVPHPAPYDKLDYNTWRDFKQEKIPLPEDFNIETNIYIAQYKEFISNLLGNIEECVQYFIAWCANIIQNPSSRSCICMVLYSLEEGAGKNMIIKTFEKCLGENYVNYISDVSNQLFGKHSSAEMNKLLIVLNEVKGKDTYTNTDLFKTRITDDKREVELKGKDTTQINNYASYILNSNNLNVVNAGERDRRFCVLDCNNAKINDKKYFKSYENNVNNNPEAIRCIYEYLKKFNIEEVVPDYIFSDARPKTELYNELVECNRAKEWDFLEYVTMFYPDNDNVKITHLELWSMYKIFCNENNYNISLLSSRRFLFMFNRTIVNYVNKTPDYLCTIEHYKSNNIRGYDFNLVKLRKWFNIDYTIEKLTPIKKKNKFIED